MTKKQQIENIIKYLRRKYESEILTKEQVEIETHKKSKRPMTIHGVANDIYFLNLGDENDN